MLFWWQVPIVPGQVYSINDALSADGTAEDYEFGLRQLVKTRIVDVLPSSDCPRFDLILLGMGPDGHVASLFPKHPLVFVMSPISTLGRNNLCAIRPITHFLSK